MKLIKAKVTLMLIVANNIMVLLSLKMTFHYSHAQNCKMCKICEKYQYNAGPARDAFSVRPCVNMEHPTHAFKQEDIKDKRRNYSNQDMN